MTKLCLSVRGFKRPHYLKKCLESLEANTDLDVDFYFFQDGAVNPISGKRYATDEEVKDSLKVFVDSKLPNKTIYESKVNLSPSVRNEFQLKTLFPKYEYVVLLDNDLVFNKYYIKTLKTLFKQFKKDKNAGIIQTSFRHDNNYQSEKEAKRLEDKVSYGFSHFWEMGFWRESWEKIMPHLQDYFDLTRECDFSELLYNPEVYQDVRLKLYKKYGAYSNGLFPTEDYAIIKSAEMAGYKGLHTLSLRHKSIGEEGMFSFKGDRWKQQGFSGIELFNVGDVDKYQIND